MITLTFFGILMLAIAVSLVDWRRGWILGILCGVLQDPARKLTPGTPVEMNFSVLLVYLVILFAAQRTLLRSRADIARRYPALTAAFGLILFCLALAAVNGVFTYGVEYWKVPALSLFIYLLPIPAVIIGYTYMRREEDLFAFFRYYSVLTCIAMIGTPLEYFRVNWRALGIVALPEGFIRYVPGLQIRILAGFYRAGDIMAWHAAMLTIIGITMSFRAGMIRKAWPWALVAGWGFLNCVISGRRKAIYMVVVYVTVFLWRYIRRLAFGQVVAFAAVAIVMFGVVQKIGGNEEASVYTRGATTTKDEVFERLEGGLRGTIEQFGFMGAGLGTATQGVRHLLGHDNNIGWQEGGLGKLAIELGVPGLLAVIYFGWQLFRLLMQLTRFDDEPDSTKLARVALFGIFVANVVEFMVSAQAYSDALLVLMTSFLLGCLMSTPVLADRVKEATAQATSAMAPPVRVGALA